MINKKKFSALVLAGTMLFSMGTNVFAAGETIPDVNNNGKVTITKDFEMADGLATPNVTFKFTATSETPDALPAMIEDISYAAGDKGRLKDEKYVISKDTAISFTGNWKHAGEYVYTVTESQENPVENVTYDTSSYKLRVYVINEGNGLKVQKITAEGKDGKTNRILFTNTYTKNDATLTIEKNTEGDYADKTRKFDFEITFTKSPMSDQTTFTGTIGAQSVECTAGQTKTFKLADGEQLDTLKKKKKNNLVGENENKVTFTNTYKDVAVTGIVMNNLPFILLVAVAIVAFVSLAVVKRRRTSGK